MSKLQLILTITLLYVPLFSQAAEPVIRIDNQSHTINIDPQGNTEAQILNALAQTVGFNLIGPLEIELTRINQPLQGNAQQLIEQLVKPQSVIVLFSSDEEGNKYISEVELLPTGKTDSQFLNDGTIHGYKPPEVVPESYEDKQARLSRYKERQAAGKGNRGGNSQIQ